MALVLLVIMVIVFAIAAIVLAAYAIAWWLNYMAAIYYIEIKSHTTPTKEEFEVCRDYAIKRIVKDMENKWQHRREKSQ